VAADDRRRWCCEAGRSLDDDEPFGLRVARMEIGGVQPDGAFEPSGYLLASAAAAAAA